MTTSEAAADSRAKPGTPLRFRADPQWARRNTLPLRILLGLAPAEPTDTELADLAAALTETDPLGARVAHAIQTSKTLRMSQVRRALTDGLAAVPDAPAELIDFVTTVTTRPAWVDDHLLERGAEVCRRGGATSLDILGQALVAGYQMASTPNIVLTATGRLNVDNSHRRIGETTAWWCQVVQPGGMRVGGAGWAATVHVRLMHALVNSKFRSRADWDYRQWGEPINNADQAATYQLFASYFLVGVRALGYPVTGEEGRAVMHLWKYMGWLIGVDEQFLVDTERQGLEFMYRSALTAQKPGVEAAALTAAYAAAQRHGYYPLWAPLARWWAYQRTLSVTSLFLAPHRMPDAGLPVALPWYPLAKALPSLAVHYASRLIPGGRAVMERRGSAVQRRVLRRFFGPDAIPAVNTAEY